MVDFVEGPRWAFEQNVKFERFWRRVPGVMRPEDPADNGAPFVEEE